MKTEFTLKELDQIASGAYKTFDLVCQDIEEGVTNDLDITDDDYEDEEKEELMYNLKDYIFPWNDYNTKMDALKWLKENGYITDAEED